MSDIAYYHEVSPDPSSSECPVTGLAEDGVAFPNTDEHAFQDVLFLGRTAMYEGFAALTGIKPGDLKKLVDSQDTIKALRAENKQLKADLAKWQEWASKAESVGLVIEPL
jgi:hypothetical protein